MTLANKVLDTKGVDLVTSDSKWSEAPRSARIWAAVVDGVAPEPAEHKEAQEVRPGAK